MLTDDEILDLVRDADLDWHAGWSLGLDENRYVILARAVERAAVAAEREACAKVCDELVGSRAMARHCADAIRARNEEQSNG